RTAHRSLQRAKRQVAADHCLVGIKAIAEIARWVTQVPMGPHDANKFAKASLTARECLRLSMLAEATHEFRNIFDPVALSDAHKNIPIHAPVEFLVQKPDFIENAAAEVDRLR